MTAYGQHQASPVSESGQHTGHGGDLTVPQWDADLRASLLAETSKRNQENHHHHHHHPHQHGAYGGYGGVRVGGMGGGNPHMGHGSMTGTTMGNLGGGGPDLTRPFHERMMDETERNKRAESIQRYREKRDRRHFDKKIRYQSRKAYAEKRPRIKGRFATKEEVELLRAQAIAQAQANGEPIPDWCTGKPSKSTKKSRRAAI